MSSSFLSHKKNNLILNKFLTYYLYLLIIAYAISVTMIGPVMPVLIEQYNLKFSQGGLISTFQSLGNVLSILLGGFLADFIKKSKLVCIAFFVYIISLLFISIELSFFILLIMFFILGASTKMIDMIINAFISDLHPERRTFYLGLLHAAYGIGALIGPLYSRTILNSSSIWNQAFRLLGVICLAILIGFIIILTRTKNQEKANARVKGKEYFKVFSDARVIILCFTVLLYFGHQYGITVWMPMYSEKIQRFGDFFNNYILSFFWVGIIIGRLTCSSLSSRFGTRRLMIFGSLLGGILLSSALLADNPIILVISLIIAGALTGGTAPLVISLICSWYPQNSGAVTSANFLSISIGSMVFPWLIGLTAEVFSFKLGMLLTGITLLLMPLLLLLLPYVEKKKSIFEQEGD